MRSLLTAFTGAAAGTALVSPLVRRAMLRWQVMDVPNHRSSHRIPTPRGGGIACLAGVAVGQACARVGAPLRVLLPAVALAGVGLLDDRNGLEATHRLLAQLAAGTGSGLGMGLPAAPLAGAIAFPSVVNVVNFMDGINGITGLTVIVWGLNAVLVGRRSANDQLATVGAITAGAGLGFLPANVPEADLFLGDVGSYLFGGLLAGGIVLGIRQGVDVVRLAAPGALYLSDALQAIIRRHRLGQPLTEAHREHVYQRLVDEGKFSHVQVALFHAGLAATVGGAASAFPPVVALGVAGLAVTTYLKAPDLARRTPPGVSV